MNITGSLCTLQLMTLQQRLKMITKRTKSRVTSSTAGKRLYFHFPTGITLGLNITARSRSSVERSITHATTSRGFRETLSKDGAVILGVKVFLAFNRVITNRILRYHLTFYNVYRVVQNLKRIFSDCQFICRIYAYGVYGSIARRAPGLMKKQ
jgi:hypothetical protein